MNHRETIAIVASANGWTTAEIGPRMTEHHKGDAIVRVLYSRTWRLRHAHRAESDSWRDVWPGATDKLAKVIALLDGVDTSSLTDTMVASLSYYVDLDITGEIPAQRTPDTTQRAALVTRGLLTPGYHHELTDTGRTAAAQLFPAYQKHVQRFPRYQRPQLPEGYQWGHQPRLHGVDEVDREQVYPGRAVLIGPGLDWPHVPEACEDTSGTGMWMLDDQVMVCRGCGLDST
jgi:hypothetical protein